jgi:hypothetical protein
VCTRIRFRTCISIRKKNSINVKSPLSKSIPMQTDTPFIPITFFITIFSYFPQQCMLKSPIPHITNGVYVKKKQLKETYLYKSLYLFLNPNVVDIYSLVYNCPDNKYSLNKKNFIAIYVPFVLPICLFQLL